MAHVKPAAEEEMVGMLRNGGYTSRGFTLIELLVVISIIAVLIGLAFPAYQGVQNAARKTQAKNDLVQIVTAVNAFYTEYGKYPTNAADDAAAKLGPGGSDSTGALFNTLRGLPAATLNPRQIVFMSPPEAADQTNSRNGINNADGQLYDPWGTAYAVAMDADYDNQVSNPYDADTGAGAGNIRQGVIAWSLGKNGPLGGSGG
ncbi:MAG: type II secretion system protein, partial [Chthoniobacterales bacterium]